MRTYFLTFTPLFNESDQKNKMTTVAIEKNKKVKFFVNSTISIIGTKVYGFISPALKTLIVQAQFSKGILCSCFVSQKISVTVTNTFSPTSTDSSSFKR